MNYLQLIKQKLNDLPRKRKLCFSLAALLIFLLTSLVCWWVLTPVYAVLFNQLDEQDANQILSQLEQANISYQLRNGGNDILIDKDLIAKTRLKIMGSGMGLKGNVGFELFDKSDFGMTDFSQKINYQRALQGELERTIASFDEVRQARVHLVLPEHLLFDKENNKPKAAVTLQLKKNITLKQVQSIQQLISASVTNLDMNQVIVVDQNGNTLTANKEETSSSQLSMKKKIEQYLNDKVNQILYKIYPKEQVLVKIDASINYDELQRELIKPQKNGPITHEKEIKHRSATKTKKGKPKEELTIEKSYQIGSEKELFKQASGTIERLTISVVLPKNTSKQIITQIQRLVKSTVGFNEQRGDLISVEALIGTKQTRNKKTPDNIKVTAPPKPDFYTNYNLILGFVFLFVFIGSTIILTSKKIRCKHRENLLMELTQWLTHHE